MNRFWSWLFRVGCGLLLFSSAVPAQPAAPVAAPTAAGDLRTKIEQVFEEHYLTTEFDAAEAGLLALIQGCDASCSRADLAHAWMYIGIVRGGGRQDAEGAKQAFEQALALDPKVQLDVRVANPETTALFAAAGGKVSGAAPPEPRPELVREARPEDELRAEAARFGLVCGPQLASLQTRRVLPVWCETNLASARVTLRYHAFNADDWVSVRMNVAEPAGKGQRFQAEVPCSVTEFAGPLEYFVTLTNREGGLVATLGNLKEPLVVGVSEQVDQPPPAFPGAEARARCEARETCPPDFPGCADPAAATERGDREWGQACTASRECQKGLYCEREGFCEVSRECRADADCPAGGACVDGLCDGTARAAGKTSSPFSAFGLHFAIDFGPVAGDDVCSTRDTDFDCVATQTGRTYPGELPEAIALEDGEPGDPYPGTSVGGFARGSMRVMLSYDRSVLSKLTVGGRLGVAFNGAPSGVDQPAFLPLQLEARASYWLFGTETERVRPFVFLGGGLAQVDLQKDAVVRDCSTEPSRGQFQDCINAEGDYESAPATLPEVEVTATRRLGRGFVGGGVGVFVPVYRNLGVVPQVGGLLMFPEVGFVLQPSLGAMLAF
ncbi:MAG TPA: dickkopf-related protein [Polyangiaceae bacterium]